VFSIWDVLSGRAVFPARGQSVAPVTGLSGRPIPVEQADTTGALVRVLLTQWAEPFTTR
jgi:hypothetical protein